MAMENHQFVFNLYLHIIKHCYTGLSENRLPHSTTCSSCASVNIQIQLERALAEFFSHSATLVEWLSGSVRDVSFRFGVRGGWGVGGGWGVRGGWRVRGGWGVGGRWGLGVGGVAKWLSDWCSHSATVVSGWRASSIPRAALLIH